MWYYLFKDGKKIDFLHVIDDKYTFEKISVDDLIEQWLTFDDQTIASFFMRVCNSTPLSISATIDGHLYSLQWEGE
jgi:hypothetical protein